MGGGKQTNGSFFYFSAPCDHDYDYTIKKEGGICVYVIGRSSVQRFVCVHVR